MTNDCASPAQFFLGIEGGATRTVAILADAQGNLIQRIESGPANLRLLSDPQLTARLLELARELPRPLSIGIGLAGARDEKDWQRVAKLVEKTWPGVPCRVTHDLATTLAAAEIRGDDRQIPRVIVLSGTGSCCYGRSPNGNTAKLGGWGHILGDKGSGFEIGLRALKAVVYYFDRDGAWSRLGRQILRTLQLNEPADLIGWVQGATKQEIAALAVEVFAASAKGDEIANDILEGAAGSLAKDAISCARRLAKPSADVEFVFAGSVLLKQPAFRHKVAKQIAKSWAHSRCVPLRMESVWGAVALAHTAFMTGGSEGGARWTKEGRARGATPSSESRLRGAIPKRSPAGSIKETNSDNQIIPVSPTLSPTEERNPRSMGLHKLSLGKSIRLMLSEEANVPAAVLVKQKEIERALKLIVRSFRRGGKLFYIGAGTSGRIGVLDASECPPTFGTSPELVQGIIAGGQRALWQAVEGAEDDAAAGARAIEFRGVKNKDVIVGLAASGRTPFVWGGLAEAKRRGAATILICFNPHLDLIRRQRPDVLITPNVGPEVLTGSTRLKCGTATKLILNLFTTLAMVKFGKVVSNLMIDLKPSNEKLRERAVRILCQLTKCGPVVARATLEKSDWVVKEAWHRLSRGRESVRLAGSAQKAPAFTE